VAEGFGENARRGGFAGAARSDEDVGVVHAVAFDGVFQRGDHMILSHHIVEILRPVFPGQNLIGLG